MHDPMTQAFRVRIPLPWKKENRFSKNNRREWQFYELATIWHNDPEKDHTDDSCGWFMRSRHGDKDVLEKIVKRYEYDWDRVFDSEGGNSYFCGYFTPDGDPHFSVLGITINLFMTAASEHFGCDGRTNWKKAKQFISKHLLEIMLFSENPTDSLFDGMTRKFEIGCGEKHTPQRRKDRIRNMAGCIYSWILRAERPWWKHPRWHIHHWSIQLHPWQTLRRWLFDRCCKCGKGFKFGDHNVCTVQWDNPKPKFLQSTLNIYHGDCGGTQVASSESTQPS